MRTLPDPSVRVRDTAVDLRSVTRLFGTVPAVVRVDLSIDRGEAVVLRGPNGAGKSTLLRIVATAISPTFGGGSVLGFDLIADREQIRARCELLTHRTRLYEELTALENVRVFTDLLELEPERADRALERVGLSAEAGERVRGFSSGMRQRVAIARTIARDPDLLLLDEPATALDQAARELVGSVIVDASARGRTVLIATHHDVPDGLHARVVSMRDGRIGAAA